MIEDKYVVTMED